MNATACHALLHSLKPDRHTPDVVRSPQRPKCCDNKNEDEDNSLKESYRYYKDGHVMSTEAGCITQNALMSHMKRLQSIFVGNLYARL